MLYYAILYYIILYYIILYYIIYFVCSPYDSFSSIHFCHWPVRYKGDIHVNKLFLSCYCHYRHLLRKLGISYFSMYEIDKFGMSECITRALKKVNPQ